VITKVVHGWRVGGLIAYLMGPGRAEEHRNPHVIASWDGRDAGWQPVRSGPAEWDLELGPLIRAMRAPAVAAGLTETPESEGKRGYVWHCSARVAAADRTLTDAEWASVARELLHGAGVAERDDPGGPRWVAVRHADDHIHIAVVLVRQDTGRRFWPYRDYPKLRVAAQAVERRFGLTVTAGADGTAERAPSRGEREKAARQGRVPSRVALVRAVRRAAVAATDVASFESGLRDAGVLVEVRRAPPGDPLGYKVAMVGDVTAAGFPIFFSGSKLAADLSLPRLLRRWESAAGDRPERGEALTDARLAVGRARRALAAGGGDVAEVVHAAADVVTAAGAWELDGTTLEAACVPFDRAARIVGGRVGRASAESVELRRVARRLIRRRPPSDGDELAAAVALALALAALAREIAGWHRDRGRPHQAAAAMTAAGVVEAWSTRWPVASRRGRGVDERAPVPATEQPRLDPRALRRSERPRG